MAVKTKTVNNALVYYEDAYYQRWLDAIGQNVTKYLPNVGLTDETTGVTWTTTETGTSYMVKSLTAGQLYTITTGATEYDGVNAQLLGEAFKCTTSSPFYFGISCTSAEATQKDFLVGLAETDTTLTAASSSHAIAVSGDGAFFSSLDGSTTIAARTYLDGAETATANHSAVMTTSAAIYEIYWDGATLYYYVDNVLVTSTTGALVLPDGDMTPSICYRDGDGSAGEVLTVNWLRVIQLN